MTTIKIKIELSAEDLSYASEQVEAGRYKNINEATRMAFKVLRLREQQLAEVREDIEQCCADMDAGNGLDMTSAEYDSMLDEAATKLLMR
jgi:putative addiction module CopG family antidote